MRKLILSAVLLLNCAVSIMAQEDLDAKYGTELLKPGTEAPNFTLRALLGKKLELNKTRGGYVVLDFWASWCGDCRKDMPAMSALSRTYFDKGVQFVGVSFDTDSAAWYKCATDVYKLVGAQVSELKKWKETQVSKDYHINWIPTLYLLDPEGKVDLATVEVAKLEKRLQQLDADGTLARYRLQVPQFKGGLDAFVKFMQNNLKYPEAARKAGLQGRVMVGFMVSEDGTLNNIHVERYQPIEAKKALAGSLTTATREAKMRQCVKDLEKEAMRVVGKMPRWEPGIRNGRAVNAQFTVPVTFRLQ
jgi:TonB family protein